MGYNLQGDLGDGTNVKTNRPEQVVASGVTAIAAGFEHSLFIKSDGSLWGMGSASTGQLGGATLINTNRPEEIVVSGVTAIAAGSLHSLFLKSDGSLAGDGLRFVRRVGRWRFQTDRHPGAGFSPAPATRKHRDPDCHGLSSTVCLSNPTAVFRR